MPATKKKPVGKPCVDGTQGHRYLLDAPDGGLVGGACKKCGRERTWAESPAAIKKLAEYGR